MRYVPPAVAAARAARVSTHVEVLVWILARNRSTGEVESMGLWSGDDVVDFTIGAETRTYYGAGALLEVPDIQASTGLEVRTISLTLAAMSPEVETLIRGYDVRFGAVQIHRAEFGPTGALLGEPERIFKGFVNGAPITTPEIGGTGSAALQCVSHSRVLTRHGSVTKSDQVQQSRGGDRFRRYGTLTAAAAIYWGEKKGRGSDAAPASDRAARNTIPISSI